MKILFICENYVPHYGGAEVVFKNLAERYVREGHQATILTHQLKGTKKREVINGVDVVRVPSLFSRYVFTITAIKKAISLARKHDIIQTTTFNGAPPAWLAAMVTGKPIVITIHEVWIGKWSQVTNLPWFSNLIHEFLEKCIYLLPYDKYICVSEATRKDLLKIGISPKKAITIHNGLDYKFWNKKKFQAPEVINNNEFIYFSWGRPGPSKGFEYLLRAVPLIKLKLPQAKLHLMLGSKEKYQSQYCKLRKIIADLGIEQEILLHPSKTYLELGYLINAADCVVIPSTSEGFGYNVVEAAALEKPIVASDIGSIPEVISGKYNLCKARDPKDLAEKIVKTAQGDVKVSKPKKFLWNKAIDSYLTVYKQLRQ